MVGIFLLLLLLLKKWGLEIQCILNGIINVYTQLWLPFHFSNVCSNQKIYVFDEVIVFWFYAFNIEFNLPMNWDLYISSLLSLSPNKMQLYSSELDDNKRMDMNQSLMYCGTCLIRHTKGTGKCVGLYRMLEYSGFILLNIITLGP